MSTIGNGPWMFLAISDAVESPWVLTLQRALSALGTLQALPEDQAVAKIEQNDYDLILVDAGMVENAARLVARLRSQSAGVRILVFSSVPTWRRAREVLLAGATDYVKKTQDEEELKFVIESALGLWPSTD